MQAAAPLFLAGRKRSAPRRLLAPRRRGLRGPAFPRTGGDMAGGRHGTRGGPRLRSAVTGRRLGGAAGASGGGRRAGEPPGGSVRPQGCLARMRRPRFEARLASGGSEGCPRSCRRAARSPRRRAGSSASLSLGGGGRHGARRVQPASFRDPRGPLLCLLVVPGPPRLFPCWQGAGGGGEQRRGTLRAGGTVTGVVI